MVNVKAQEITNPNEPSITMWHLKHPNGRETLFRGTWKELFIKYNGNVEEVNKQ